MPNWCTCELWVSGDEESIRRFLEEVESMRSSQEEDEEDDGTQGYLIKTCGLLEAIDSLRRARNENGGQHNVSDVFALPPLKMLDAFCEELTEEEEAGLYSRFQEWRDEHPFDIETELRLQEPRKLFFTFLTRSKTPLEVFKRISQLRPDLTFDLDWYLELCNDTGIIRFANGTEELLEDRVDHSTTGDLIEECVGNFKVVLGPDNVFIVNGERFIDLDEDEGSAKLVAMLQWLHERGMNGSPLTQDNPDHVDPPTCSRELPHRVIFSDKATGKQFTLGTSRGGGRLLSMLLTFTKLTAWYEYEDFGSHTNPGDAG